MTCGAARRRQPTAEPIAPAGHSASSAAARSRWARFIGTGLLGFLLQLTSLWLLTSRARWPWLAATVVSVELAVVHNFLWHARWTWADRPGDWRVRFARFQLTNGLTSIAGNAAVMALCAGVLGWRPIPANVCAVALIAVVNFVSADRWVFRMVRGPRVVATLAAVWMLLPTSAAAQTTETIAAWQRCVAATEARLERSRTMPPAGAADPAAPTGGSIRVPSGTISDWTGSVFIRGITLDRVLQRLQQPGTPPPQEDVVSSRVIARTDDSLRVSIRLVRRAIVTVTYDTEHEMRFHRWTPRLATATSVATRIAEVGGSDHGFLWRLHSYWRYEEVDGGVRVDLESLTLSRDVPSMVRPIAAPLIARVARESMVRTLEALRRYLSSP
jgi:putative flippase GtrA